MGSLSTRRLRPSSISFSCVIDLRREIVDINWSTMSCLPFVIMEAKSPAAEVGFQSLDIGCTRFQKFRESLPPLFWQSPNSYKPAAKVGLSRFTVGSATSEFSRESSGIRDTSGVRCGNSENCCPPLQEERNNRAGPHRR
jgi:hypothetical protein